MKRFGAELITFERIISKSSKLKLLQDLEALQVAIRKQIEHDRKAEKEDKNNAGSRSTYW